jgi:uncharacterized membrane protein (UPF0127 family)
MYFKACCKNNGKCIADQVEIAQSLFQRMVGLLGRSKMVDGSGLYFPGCRSIHSFFMKISIDVLFLDKELKITKMISCLRPYRLAFSPLKTKHTLELSCGALKELQLKVGDTILLIPDISNKVMDYDTFQ